MLENGENAKDCLNANMVANDRITPEKKRQTYPLFRMGQFQRTDLSSLVVGGRLRRLLGRCFVLVRDEMDSGEIHAVP